MKQVRNANEFGLTNTNRLIRTYPDAEDSKRGVLVKQDFVSQQQQREIA